MIWLTPFENNAICFEILNIRKVGFLLQEHLDYLFHHSSLHLLVHHMTSVCPTKTDVHESTRSQTGHWCQCQLPADNISSILHTFVIRPYLVVVKRRGDRLSLGIAAACSRKLQQSNGQLA